MAAELSQNFPHLNKRVLPTVVKTMKCVLLQLMLARSGGVDVVVLTPYLALQPACQLAFKR